MANAHPLKARDTRISAVTLVPVYVVSSRLLAWLGEALAQNLGCEVVISSPMLPPQESFDHKRNQYPGEAILDILHDYPGGARGRLLGLIDADCFSKGTNFIFGQARIRGREAFVALPRLRTSFYGNQEETTVFLERIYKEAIHELGHTWGLTHCDNPKCVMFFSNSIVDTDNKERNYCEKCKQILERSL